MQKYKVGDLIRVVRLVGNDRAHGLRVADVHEVVEVNSDGLSCVIELPSGKRGMINSQIELYIPNQKPDIIGRLSDRGAQLEAEILQHALDRDEAKRQLKIKRKLLASHIRVIEDLEANL